MDAHRSANHCFRPVILLPMKSIAEPIAALTVSQFWYSATPMAMSAVMAAMTNVTGDVKKPTTAANAPVAAVATAEAIAVAWREML